MRVKTYFIGIIMVFNGLYEFDCVFLVAVYNIYYNSNDFISNFLCIVSLTCIFLIIIVVNTCTYILFHYLFLLYYTFLLGSHKSS